MVTNYISYNAANQVGEVNGVGMTYDANGNMTSDGVNSYTWDRANRLLSMGGVDYQYDGEGRRVQQTVSSTVTKYLLDVQPGLSVVLSETTGSNVVRNVHSRKGIHARKDASNNWHWMMQDGLGSVRAEVSNSVVVEGSQNFAPYGTSTDSLGSFGTYGFTGEPTDVNGLVYARARYYVPSIGMFASLDPFEGIEDEPMSINGYSYVRGNPVNWTDPNGESDIIGAINGCLSNPACVQNAAAVVEAAAAATLIFGVGALVAFAGVALFAYAVSEMLNNHSCDICKQPIPRFPATPPPVGTLPPSTLNPPTRPPQEYVPVATPMPTLPPSTLNPPTRPPQEYVPVATPQTPNVFFVNASTQAAIDEIKKRSNFNPNGRHFESEQEIGSYFGYKPSNLPKLPEALIQLKDGTYITIEVKNQNEVEASEVIKKFESVTNLARSVNMRISIYELFIPKRFRRFSDTSNGIDAQGYLTENGTREKVNGESIKVNIRDYPPELPDSN